MIRHFLAASLAAAALAVVPAAHAVGPTSATVVAPGPGALVPYAGTGPLRVELDAEEGEYEAAVVCVADRPTGGVQVYEWSQPFSHVAGPGSYSWAVTPLTVVGACSAIVSSASDVLAYSEFTVGAKPVPPVGVSRPAFTAKTVYFKKRPQQPRRTRATYALSRPAEVTALVRKRNGRLMGRIALGQVPAGKHAFWWSGQVGEYDVFVPAGRYRFSLEAVTADGARTVSPPGEVRARYDR